MQNNALLVIETKTPIRVNMTKRPKKKNVKSETPKRLKPKGEVLRELYLKSGNVCAFPGCPHVMINIDGVMIGEICHIEAALPEGKRFNKNMSNEDRRAFANLILMCGAHHTLIDSSAKTYPVAKVRKYKTTHEAKFAEITNTLGKRFSEQLLDNTDTIETTLPKTLKRFLETEPDCFAEGDVPDVIEDLEAYSNQLNKVPDTERHFMLSCILRSKKLGFGWDGRVEPDAEDIISALGVSGYKLGKHAKALERYDVGFMDDPEPGVNLLRVFDPSELMRWCDIASFCDAHDIDLRRIVVDVNFALLD